MCSMIGFLKFYTFFMEDTKLTFKLLFWRFKCKSIFLSTCMGIMQVEIKRAEPKQPLQGMDLGQEEEMMVATMVVVVVECMEHTLREQLMEAWVAEEAM